MGLGIIIGAIIHGIAVVGGKVWNMTRDFVSWLFGVMPGPLKFFMFLYMIMFLLSSIMPVFLGAGNSCSTTGDIYKINPFEIRAKTVYMNNMVKVCTGSDAGLTTFGDFVEEAAEGGVWQRTWMTIKRVWGIWVAWGEAQESNFTANITLDPFCTEFNSLNISDESITRDFVLTEWGTPIDQEGYENIIHIGCTKDREGDYFPTIQFYTVDIFDFKLWLLIGLFSVLITFAFKWYHQTMK